MQSTNTTWTGLLQDPLHYKEVRVLADGVELIESVLVSAATTGSLYTTPGVGNCCSRQLRLSLRSGAAITQGMTLEVQVRLVRGDTVSEWLPKGVFDAGLPETDPVSGIMSIHSYDAMMRSEAVWLTADYDLDDWPKSESETVADIAQRMGVELDPRTVLDNVYPVDYPVDENGALSMRQVLSYIAVANGGNWIMTDGGKLRLVPFGDTSADSSDLGDQAAGVVKGDVPDPYTKIILMVDQEHYYDAGDDTGRTLEVTCPWGSQAMAASILAKISPVSIRPYTADDAMIDPAAELGDGISIAGITSVLATEDILLDGLYSSDISAPAPEQLGTGTTYRNEIQRSADRELARTRSLITKTADEIRLIVEAQSGEISRIDLKVDGITAAVQDQDRNISIIDQRVDSITSTVQDQNNNISEIEQSVSGIKMTVQSQNGAISRIDQRVDSITTTVQSQNGVISSISQEVGRISTTIQDQNGNISEIVQSVDGLTARVERTETGLSQTLSFGENGLIVSNQDGEAVEINGGQLKADTVTASRLQGETVYLLNASGEQVASFTTNEAESTSDLKLDIAAPAISVVANGGSLYLGHEPERLLNGNESHLMLDDDAVYIVGQLLPTSSGSTLRNLGSKYYMFNDIYCSNPTINTSDRNEKRDIVYDLADYDRLFDTLKPCGYKFIEDSHNRIHIGMISQDVEQALDDCGLTSMDFAGFIKSELEDGTYRYGLRYGEFIGLLVDQVQKLKARVARLED